jgi:hypothetical protein
MTMSAKRARTSWYGAAGAGRQMSEALAPYAAAFCSEEAAADTSPFLTYMCKGADGGIEKTEFTRSQLWELAKTAAGVLKAHGLAKGDCVTHYFNRNSYLDVAFRLGATMLGCVPVTVNWQADTPERVLYKLSATKSKLMLTDDGVPAAVLELVGSELPDLVVGEADTLIQSGVAIADDEMCSDLGPTDTRIIIFTSGTVRTPAAASSQRRCLPTPSPPRHPPSGSGNPDTNTQSSGRAPALPSLPRLPPPAAAAAAAVAAAADGNAQGRAAPILIIRLQPLDI